MSSDPGLHQDRFLVQRTALPGSSWLPSLSLGPLVSECGFTRLLRLPSSLLLTFQKVLRLEESPLVKVQKNIM